MFNIYKQFRTEKDEKKRKELKDKFYKNLALFIISKSIDGNIEKSFQEIKEKIIKERVKEHQELVRAFDSIERLLF